MKKINILLLIPAIFFIVLTGCQSLKDGLSGSKKQNSDEFLIEKKNPLTKPPDYEKLPSPVKEAEVISKDNTFDLRSTLEKSLKKNKKNEGVKTQNSTLEKSISEKIKNN